MYLGSPTLMPIKRSVRVKYNGSSEFMMYLAPSNIHHLHRLNIKLLFCTKQKEDSLLKYTIGLGNTSPQHNPFLYGGSITLISSLYPSNTVPSINSPVTLRL